MVKRLLKVSVLVSLVSASLVGCSVNNTKVAEYNDMQSLQEYRNSEVDLHKYDEVVLAIMDSDTLYLDKLQEVIDQYSEILDTDIVTKLQGEVVSDTNEDIDNEEELLENPYNNVEIGRVDDEYALYGTQYTVIGYGTREEAQEYIDNFNELQENTIQEVNCYNNMVVYKLENKYLGSFLVQFEIKDGKLHNYNKFEMMKGAI